jgi:peptidoglycan hydrolase CwlO-like protein
MKKNILLFPVIGLLFACSEGNQGTENPEVLQEQTETIEQSADDLEEVIQRSEEEIDEVQSEIDVLLKKI